MRFLRKRSNDGKKSPALPDQLSPDKVLEQYKDRTISTNLEENIKLINSLLEANPDLVTRRFHVFGKYPAVMFYFSNMVDQTMINFDILKPFIYMPPHLEGRKIGDGQLKNILINETIIHSGARLQSNIVRVIDAILEADSVVLIEGVDEAFLFSTRNVESRAVGQPQTEQVIRGPREGFVESLSTNTALMRYRLKTPSFQIRNMVIGKYTKSNISICYIKGIANPDLVKEVENRLSKIKIDGVLDTGYLEQFIEDNHISPFPQVLYTERPDKAVAQLLEGRVAILMDGSPFALIVPTVFTQFYQVTEDYYERPVMGSFIRLSRLLALIFALIVPSLYVAVISFNPELLPTEFAVAVAGGRASVPYPTVVEVFMMETAMEVLREATVRLPKQVGGALSIVGVLIIGQAAVAAGFASPITVVVIALTTIGSFATPAYNAALALRLLRFFLIIMAGIFGLYGVMIGLILISNHLLSLRSFGIPYMSPIAPGNLQGVKDTLIRAPLWWMKKRPESSQPVNEDRVSGQTVQATKEPPDNPLGPKRSN
ncbi:spore gernimation protein GerA [Cohnella kolymensis]|uniref:Spore gernimation protein GerA n=1 Tax=Cohnella kolymensis TaxID=1590652 RepID=A0ABR5AAB2_9BACL|nr:spore germination protein [Cohnella kolymensis]KIL37347.1 spore gernimation protein GerA [Cohnella kolymensis]